MTSDTERRLDEINRKLQIMIENSYLAKLDLFFSVLASLTIFGGGLLLSNFSLQKNVVLISLEAFFPVLIYTLIGEAYSILEDEVTTRFGFWLVLASNSVFLVDLFLVASILTFFEFFSVYVLLPLGYALALTVIYSLNKYLELFWRYITKFPTRFPNVQESYGRETRKLLKPMMLGVVTYMASFLVLVVYSFLVAT
jgi:hypothetical protein